MSFETISINITQDFDKIKLANFVVYATNRFDPASLSLLNEQIEQQKSVDEIIVNVTMNECFLHAIINKINEYEKSSTINLRV